jgi:hypothetical protein
LNKDVFNQVEAHFKLTQKWKNLENAYVNFTHWTSVSGDHGSVPYQKEGLYVAWLRQNACICQANFPSIDLVIPMAFPEKGVVTPEQLSVIVISVKNCQGTEGVTMGDLSKEAIEGKLTESESQNRKRDDLQGGKKPNLKWTHAKKHLNVRLTLNAVKFLNPGGVVSEPIVDDCWIEPSEEKPYIAFAMSMKNADAVDHLFNGENKVASYTFLSYLLERESSSDCVCVERPHADI